MQESIRRKPHTDVDREGWGGGGKGCDITSPSRGDFVTIMRLILCTS